MITSARKKPVSARDSKTKESEIGPPGPRRERRELLETVIFVLVLVALLRAFGAEAFVIPTGSMATTLLGGHKDIVCPQCGHESRVNASPEHQNVDKGICQNCRQLLDLGPRQPNLWQNFLLGLRKWIPKKPEFLRNLITLPWEAHGGDRVLVGKFLYEGLDDPDRWEIVVFKYPVLDSSNASNHTSRTNFIKRLVGKPEETIAINYGDIWVKDRRSSASDFQIARKSAKVMMSVRRLVYDNDQQAKDLVTIRALAEYLKAGKGPEDPEVENAVQTLEELGFEGYTEFKVEPKDLDNFVEKYSAPPCWQSENPSDGWTAAEEGSFISSENGKAWLVYNHILGGGGRRGKKTPRLITDFEAYNSASSQPIDWVGDLMIDCRMEFQKRKGKVIFELGEGGRRYQCVFDLAGQKVTLLRNAATLKSESLPTGSKGSFEVSFANFDDRLTLWVDNDLVFGEGVEVEPLTDAEAGPQLADLKAVRIGAENASVTIRHLKLFRDLYYKQTAQVSDSRREYKPSDLQNSQVLANWRSELLKLPPAEFEVGKEEYFMLGDNSPRSSDGREWEKVLRDKAGNIIKVEKSHFVPRRLLLGRALILYWPPGNWKFVR